MLISEIFYSIQGEGALMGTPSVFIRTSGCNLRCRWCDTPYASWNPEGEEMSVEQIVADAGKYPTRFVVITGGEPMIAKGMAGLLTELKALDKHITIETAGTVPPGDIACDLASISPKLADSTPTVEMAGSAWVQKHESTRIQSSVLREWCANYEYQLKFVISSVMDIHEAEEVVRDIGIAVPPEKVLLMPEGTDMATLRKHTPLILEWCKERGYRFSPRLHIELFGNKRGT